MRKIFIAASVFALFLASACNQPGSTNEEGEATLTDTAEQANAELPSKENTEKIVKAYIVLKNQLVLSDAAAGKKAAAALEDELIEVKGCAEAANMARQIASTDKIEEQRRAFLTLSKDVIPLAKGMKRASALYVAYCPMANDGKGGYWLSENKEIKNPYYGKTMLECGEVEEVLK
jgi:hypothetical protein